MPEFDYNRAIAGMHALGKSYGEMMNAMMRKYATTRAMEKAGGNDMAYPAIAQTKAAVGQKWRFSDGVHEIVAVHESTCDMRFIEKGAARENTVCKGWPLEGGIPRSARALVEVPVAPPIDWSRWLPPREIERRAERPTFKTGQVWAFNNGLVSGVLRITEPRGERSHIVLAGTNNGCMSPDDRGMRAVLVQDVGQGQPTPPEKLYGTANGSVQAAAVDQAIAAALPVVRRCNVPNCTTAVAHAGVLLCEAHIFARMRDRDEKLQQVRKGYRGEDSARYEHPQSHSIAAGGIFDIRPLKHRFVEEARYKYPEVDEFDLLPDA